MTANQIFRSIGSVSSNRIPIMATSAPIGNPPIGSPPHDIGVASLSHNVLSNTTTTSLRKYVLSASTNLSLYWVVCARERFFELFVLVGGLFVDEGVFIFFV